MVNHSLGTLKIIDVHKMFCLFTRDTEIALEGEKSWQDAKISFSRPRICYFEGFSAALALPNHCSLPNPVHLRVKPKNVLSLFILYLREIIPEMTE